MPRLLIVLISIVLIGTGCAHTIIERRDTIAKLRVELIVDTLARGAQRARQPIKPIREIVIADNFVGSGAMLGGGTLIIDDEIARAYPDDELAALIAHELGHLNYGHIPLKIAAGGTGCLCIGGGAAALLATTPVGWSILGILGLETGREIAFTAYTRSQEREADTFSVWLLAVSGYDPYAVARMLKHLEPKDAHNFTIFSMHPDIDDRIADVTREATRYQRPTRASRIFIR